MVPDPLRRIPRTLGGRLPDSFPGRLQHVRDRTRRGVARGRALAAAHPIAVLFVVASLCQAYAGYRVYEPLDHGVWPVLRDSVIFEYIGWHLAQGGRLYVTMWEVKPPLAFELLAALAALTGSLVWYHALVLVVTSLGVVGCSVMAGAVVHELTADPLATVVAGLGVFTLPHLFWRALIGFKSKYFVVAFGLLCLYLALRDRPVLAGVAGAVAVGFWQLAVIFPAVGLGVFAADRGARRRYVGAGVATGAAMLVPVVWWNALPAMVAESVLAPVLVTDDFSLAGRFQFVVRMIGMQIPLVLVGLVGLTGSLARDRIRREWPVAVTTGWFVAVMLLLDFDNRPDLYPFYALVAVGIGLAVARGDGLARRALAASVVVFALVGVATMGGYATGHTGMTSTDTFDTASEVPLTWKGGYNMTERQYVFWNSVEPQSCRIFGGLTQLRLVDALGFRDDPGHWRTVPCGRLGPTWEAFVAKYD